MKKALGDVSRYVNRQIPGALEDETICGRLARTLGPLSIPCLLIDSVMGIGHCYDEMEWALKGLRKK